MKKIMLVLIAIFLMTGTQQTKAQVSVSVNIGTPPAWGVYGCDDTRYYFIPDIDIYYDVWYGYYWYLDNGAWVYTTILPHRYRYYDFYNGYKVVLGYRGNTPYRYYHDHCNRYYSYRNYHGPRQITYYDRGGYSGRSYAPSRNYMYDGRPDRGYRQSPPSYGNRSGVGDRQRASGNYSGGSGRGSSHGSNGGGNRGGNSRGKHGGGGGRQGHSHR